MNQGHSVADIIFKKNENELDVQLRSNKGTLACKARTEHTSNIWVVTN